MSYRFGLVNPQFSSTLQCTYVGDNDLVEGKMSTCSNCAAFYLDVLGVGNMNSISIWALSWCCDGETRNPHIIALFKGHMDLLAVFNLQVVHIQAVTRVERYCL